MKKRIILFAVLAILIIGIGGVFLYRHFVLDQIMDWGGMENPDFAYPLDGDRTYVDNSALWPVLEGTWKSTDGRWQAVIGEESGIFLTADGETVLESPLHFTYLRPGKVFFTELQTDIRTLRSPDTAALGRIVELCHNAGEGEDAGTLLLRLEWPEAGEETIQFQKTNIQEQ